MKSLREGMTHGSKVVWLSGVTKRYRRGGEVIPAVDGLSLSVSSGELVALVGPSGCGKSTTLALVAGVDRPDEGSISVAGVDLVAAAEPELVRLRRRLVGIVFQAFHLVDNLTVEENVALPLVLDGRNDRERVRGLIERVGLVDRRTHFPSELSGGEMQRTAVARALVHRPALVVADEPTGNLDSHSGEIVLELLDEMRREEGTAVLLATHSRRAASIADRIVMLQDGREGLPDAIRGESS